MFYVFLHARDIRVRKRNKTDNQITTNNLHHETFIQNLDIDLRSNVNPVRIIHGKGTGTLRAAVQQALKKNKFVKKFRLGQYGEGEDGVTIAEFG